MSVIHRDFRAAAPYWAKTGAVLVLAASAVTAGAGAAFAQSNPADPPMGGLVHQHCSAQVLETPVLPTDLDTNPTGGPVDYASCVNAIDHNNVAINKNTSSNTNTIVINLTVIVDKTTAPHHHRHHRHLRHHHR